MLKKNQNSQNTLLPLSVFPASPLRLPLTSTASPPSPSPAAAIAGAAAAGSPAAARSGSHPSRRTWRGASDLQHVRRLRARRSPHAQIRRPGVGNTLRPRAPGCRRRFPRGPSLELRWCLEVFFLAREFCE